MESPGGAGTRKVRRPHGDCGHVEQCSSRSCMSLLRLPPTYGQEDEETRRHCQVTPPPLLPPTVNKLIPSGLACWLRCWLFFILGLRPYFSCSNPAALQTQVKWNMRVSTRSSCCCVPGIYWPSVAVFLWWLFSPLIFGIWWEPIPLFLVALLHWAAYFCSGVDYLMLFGWWVWKVSFGTGEESLALCSNPIMLWIGLKAAIQTQCLGSNSMARNGSAVTISLIGWH